MTKEQTLEILKLLSALESWGFSNGKTITALASFFSAYVALKQTQGAN